MVRETAGRGQGAEVGAGRENGLCAFPVLLPTRYSLPPPAQPRKKDTFLFHSRFGHSSFTLHFISHPSSSPRIHSVNIAKSRRGSLRRQNVHTEYTQPHPWAGRGRLILEVKCANGVQPSQAEGCTPLAQFTSECSTFLFEIIWAFQGLTSPHIGKGRTVARRGREQLD